MRLRAERVRRVKAAVLVAGVCGFLANVAWAPDSWLGQLEAPASQLLDDVMAAQGYEPSPFTTDGCSGGLSLLWRQLSQSGNGPPFEHCCIRHDRSYHAAGQARDPVQSYRARLDADQSLRRCVETQLQDNPSLARTVSKAVYGAVRFAGGPCSGLSWRWGYGYPTCAGQNRDSFGRDAPD